MGHFCGVSEIASDVRDLNISQSIPGFSMVFNWLNMSIELVHVCFNITV